MVYRWLLLKGGCRRQVSIVVSLVIGRQVVVIVRWLPQEGQYSCVPSNMVDRWLLFNGGC